MNQVPVLTNEEEMSGDKFAKLNSQMKGVMLHSLSEELRNEEIMAMLSLDEKELRELCTKYGITYSFRNKMRRLDGDKSVSGEDLHIILIGKNMNFFEFITYDRPSQRKIIYGFAEKSGTFNKMIQEVFNVSFYSFFTSLYAEEKKLRKGGKVEKEEVKNTVPEETADAMKEETPIVQSNPNDLSFLDDTWDNVFSPAKKYVVQLKNNKISKKQVKSKLLFLLSEIDDVEDDMLLSFDLKIAEHS